MGLINVTVGVSRAQKQTGEEKTIGRIDGGLILRRNSRSGVERMI
jgi:hypothetical protein